VRRVKVSHRIYEFGPFRLESAERRLLRQGELIVLTPKVFDLLLALVERSGHLVSKEELLRNVWPDSFVEEANLSVNISALRRAIGDGHQGSEKYIETIPRVGYRFIALVREVARVAGEAPIHAIAVLPLSNLSADPAQDYFAEGMTEELITELAKISRLRVISRTSAMHFKGTRKTLPEIARELGVDAVVEGAVARDRDHVRISAQLIDARTDLHLWAQSYEGDLSDVLRLQERVALAIANEIKVKLTPRQQAHLGSARSISPEAHELYLRGRFHWNKRTVEGLKKSIDYFQQAVEKDPTYALAYSGLADSYNMLGLWGDLPQMESAPKAKAAATRALEIDEQLAEAHASVGWTLFAFAWDWSAAERELKRSIELNPSYATAHRWLANCLTQQGRHGEALTEGRRAHQLDPVSLITNSVLAYTLYAARQYDEAIEQEWKTLELDDQFAQAHWVLGMALEEKGKSEGAIRELQKATALDAHPLYLAALGHAYGVAGQGEQGLAIFHNLAKVSKEKNIAWNEVAILYTGMGEKERALATLETAYMRHDSQLNWLKVDPRLDRLRADPRFADLLRRMNLPQ
jgi:TolB-like protein/Flp pilus assembly protein TadD